MLGDRFFYALLAEKITKEEVKKLFSDPFKKKGEPAEVYLYWVKRLKGVKLPKRV